VRERDAYRAIDPACAIGAGDQLRGLRATLAAFQRPIEAETDFILNRVGLAGGSNR